MGWSPCLPRSREGVGGGSFLFSACFGSMSTFAWERLKIVYEWFCVVNRTIFKIFIVFLRRVWLKPHKPNTRITRRACTVNYVCAVKCILMWHKISLNNEVNVKDVTFCLFTSSQLIWYSRDCSSVSTQTRLDF